MDDSSIEPAVPDSGELAPGVRFERQSDEFVLHSDQEPNKVFHLGPWTTVERSDVGGYKLVTRTPQERQ